MASSFYFNLKQAKIFQAVKWARHPIFGWSGFLKRLFLFLFIGFAFLFLATFLSNNVLLGLSLIFFSFYFWFLIVEEFFNLKLAQPELEAELKKIALRPGKNNLAEFLSFESARAVWNALKWTKRKKTFELDSTALFYYLILGNENLNFIFYRALINIKEVKKALKEYLQKDLIKAPLMERLKARQELYSDDFQETIIESLKIAKARGHQRIEIFDLTTALSKANPIFREILIKSELKSEDIENLTDWLERIERKANKRKRFWDLTNLNKKGSFAKDWCAGYTITLDKYSFDWTSAMAADGFGEIVGHSNEVFGLERILSRLEINNALLVGRPGIGRKNIVQALTKKSFFNESLPQINYKRVVELNLPSLLSRIDSFEEVEFVLNRIFEEVVSAGNIILIIDEFHNFVSSQSKPGVIDISGILSPFLRLPQLQIIAITTFAGLHKNIEKNSSLIGLFEKVEVSEISEKETITVLERMVPFLEKKYKKFISYPVLKTIVSYSSRYLPAAPFPKKAIDLLDEIMIYTSSQRKKVLVLPEDAAKVVSDKTEIPVGKVEAQERNILLNLESLLHERIINQETAVKEVSSALRRSRVEITKRKKPMGTFLFLGPTGVGKTETSKALSAIYFGAEDRMIRLDMSEFQAIKDIPRLIGSAEQEGILTTKVREDPFSLILLDEIEKAHPNILNLFLQVLDEGHITDGLGRKVLFSNSIIIATSNAGAEVIWKDIKKDKQLNIIKEDLLALLFKRRKFRPEFINRFDAVVVFKPLTKENLLDISELMLNKIKKNLKEEKGIDLVITNELKKRIVDLGYSPAFGAREMRRVIADMVENLLAISLLKKEIKRGDKISIDHEGFEIVHQK
ncbi:ATP-dependent Clp protease ATP-binding subunit [Candidatus Parcubacteria bacterium]|nr:ATP-dependent Clp protease ATP-binding subunit [Candidatus Parcubacteria bacterium]